MADYEPNKPKINLWNFVEKPKWYTNSTKADYFRHKFHTTPSRQEYQRKWKRAYRLSPEYKQKQHDLRQEIRKNALTIFDSKCGCEHCDETNIKFLEFHHINGRGREHRKEVARTTQAQFYRWIINNPEEAKKKLLVLCSNCHHGRTFYGSCHSEVKNQ